MTAAPTPIAPPPGSRSSFVVLPWLVRLRWVSVLALVGGVAAATLSWGVLVPLGPVLTLLAAMAATNVVLAFQLRSPAPSRVVIGTSLLVIAMQSSAGLVGHLVTVSLDWPVVLAVTAMAVVGSFIGTALVGRIPEKTLRKSFGVFVLVMGFVVLAQEIPRIVAGLAA